MLLRATENAVAGRYLPTPALAYSNVVAKWISQFLNRPRDVRMPEYLRVVHEKFQDKLESH